MKMSINYKIKIIDSTNFTYRPVIKYIDRILRKNMSVLDIGCGVGTLDFYIYHKTKYIEGIDISKRSIYEASFNRNVLGYCNIDYYCKDALKYTTEKFFDFILCTEVIEHIKDDKYFINKYANYLNTYGKMLITTPLETAPLYRLGLTNNFDKRVGHLRRYSYKKLGKLIERSGLIIENVGYGEGLFRNILFVFKIFEPLVKLGNRYTWISQVLTILDNLFIRLAGPSNIYLVLSKS